MTRDAAPRFSVMVAASERLDPVEEFFPRLLEAVEHLPGPAELVVVFDGHRGAEAARFRELAAGRDAIRVVELKQRLGEGAVLSEALRLARGEILFRVPPYLQADLEVLALLAKYLESGADCVFVEREDEQGRTPGGWQRRWLNRILARLARAEVRDLACLLCGMTAEVARALPLHGDLHRYLPVVVAREGYATVHVRSRALDGNRGGDSRSARSYFARTLDLITVVFLARSTGSPLRFFGLLGLGPLLLGSALLLWLVWERVMGHVPLAGRPLLLLALLLVTAGIQSLAIGFLGELMVYLHYRDRHPTRVEALDSSESRSSAPETSRP